MLVLNLSAFENNGNGPYGKILTKKEPIRTHGFTLPHNNANYLPKEQGERLHVGPLFVICPCEQISWIFAGNLWQRYAKRNGIGAGNPANWLVNSKQTCLTGPLEYKHRVIFCTRLGRYLNSTRCSWIIKLSITITSLPGRLATVEVATKVLSLPLPGPHQ